MLISVATYKDFLEDMKEAEDLEQCRYGIFDAEYLTKDGQPRNKLVFFMWSVSGGQGINNFGHHGRMLPAVNIF